MDILVLIFLVSYLLTLGVLVFFRSKNRYAFSFATFCLGIAFWSVSAKFFSTGNFDSLLFARLSFASIIIAISSLVNFATSFPFYFGGSKIVNNLLRVISIIIFLLAFTPLIVKGIEIVDGVVNAKYGDLYPTFVIYVFISLADIFVVFSRKYWRSQKVDRLQLRYFLTGLSLTTISLLTTNLLFPALTGSSYTSQFGPLGLVFLLTFLSLAIVRQRLFDLRLIVGRGMVYFIYAAGLFSIFYGLNWFYENFTGGIYSATSLSLGVGVAVIVALTTIRVYGFLERTILGDILHTNYNLYNVSKNYIEKINTKLSMDELCASIIEGFNELFGSEKDGILILDKESVNILYKNFTDWEIDESGYKKLLLVLDVWKDQEHGDILIKEDLIEAQKKNFDEEVAGLLEFMEKYEVAAILPLNRKVALNGVFAIGEKKSREPFTVEDINLMETLIGYSSVAIGRSMLYEQANQFNKLLKEEVADATRELKKANDELKEIDNAKDDLISIASHELRTPASIVKGKLHLMKEKIAKLKSCKGYDERIEKDLDSCLAAIEREIEQINTLLEASRIGKDTMSLNLQKYSVVELVSSAVEELQSMSDEKGIELRLGQIEKEIPDVTIDVKRIREVVDNLITNAIKYTEEGKITVNITHHPNREVCISINDTGVGIPEDEIDHLFEKFFRVQNDRREGSQLVKPGGTGLGLYVAKNIVTKHDGRIWVESKVGKGSTFSFCLPINQKREKENSLLKKRTPKDKFASLKGRIKI